MKKTFKFLTILLGASIVSCTIDKAENPTVTPLSAPVLVEPVSDVTNIVELKSEEANKVVLTGKWSLAKYSDDSEVSYQMYVAKAGTNFAKPVFFSSVSKNDIVDVKASDLNTALGLLGAIPFSPESFDIKVRSFLGQSTSPQLSQWSNIITLKIKPYQTTPDRLYILGDFQSASGYGENNTIDKAAALEESLPAVKDFEGFVYFNAATSFKPAFRDKARPSVNYGGSGGVLSVDGPAIAVAEAGLYYVKVNTDAMTYSLKKTDWAITGAATPNGWPDGGVMDIDMTYNIKDVKYEITIVLTADKFKFRANDAWDLNFGGSLDKLTLGGGDLSVASDGTYKVSLDLSTPRKYKATLVKQ